MILSCQHKVVKYFSFSFFLFFKSKGTVGIINVEEDISESLENRI